MQHISNATLKPNRRTCSEQSDSSCLLRADVTYQHLLELLYRLISDADAINLPDLVSYMQSP